MNECKVSVIVPVYNVEDYLEDCMKSLLGQTLKEFEIILIDDGSTDSSGIMCDKYASEYCQVSVIHKENGGLGEARNTGVSIANGKYIYFIDSDDLLKKDALQYLYDEAEQNHLDVILFSAECFSDDPNIVFDENQYKRSCFLSEVMSGKSMFEKLYSKGEYYASIPLRFYNRKFFIKNNYSFPKIIHEDEFPGFVSLVQADRVECISHKFYMRRFRKNSIMTSKKAYDSAKGYLYTWKELVVFCKRNGVEDESGCLKYARDLFTLARNLYYNSFEENEKKECGILRKEIRKTFYKEKIKIGKGDRFFLFNPTLYGIYRGFFKK